jgi:hypothetical protein
VAILACTFFAGAALYINLVEHPTGDRVWLWGAVSILAVVPVTLLIIFPTNKRLLESGRDLASSETRELLETWGRLHAIRSALGLVASVLVTWAATHSH